MAIVKTISDNQTPGQNHHFINQWPLVALENVWHFNQCAGIGAPVQTGNKNGGICYLQTEREMIARALESAALRMSQDLNYWVCPAYFSQEIPIGHGVPLQAQTFRLRWLKLIELGSRATTLIQSNVAVTYSDPTGSGVNDTATVNVTTAIASGEVKLFFRTADGAPNAGDYRYEIEPLEVSASGGVVTLVGHRALFVKPSEWQQEYKAIDPNFVEPNVVDTAAAAGFVTAVDVYRVYTDTSANINLYAANGTLLQTFTGEIQNNEQSVVRMGDLCASFCWDFRPSRVVIHYKAGSPLVSNLVDSELLDAMFGYACGNQLTKLTKMSAWTQETWERYHAPMVESIAGNVIPIATQLQSGSAYGARTGQVKAWEVVRDRLMMRGGRWDTV